MDSKVKEILSVMISDGIKEGTIFLDDCFTVGEKIQNLINYYDYWLVKMGYSFRNENEHIKILSHKLFNEFLEHEKNSTKRSRDALMIKPYSFTYPIDYYLNSDTFPYPDFTFEVADYFDGTSFWGLKPIEFLNFFWKQLEEIHKRINKPTSVISMIHSLPISSIDIGVFYYFLMRWCHHDFTIFMDSQTKTVFRLLEREFINLSTAKTEQIEYKNSPINWNTDFAEFAESSIKKSKNKQFEDVRQEHAYTEILKGPELAIRHGYLVQVKAVESPTSAREVLRFYNGAKNVNKYWSTIVLHNKIPHDIKNYLLNIKNTLNDYPKALSLLEKDLEELEYDPNKSKFLFR